MILKKQFFLYESIKKIDESVSNFLVNAASSAILSYSQLEK